MTIYSRLMCFAGTLPCALLLVFLYPETPFFDIHVTAVATLALYCALPMVDSSLFGTSVNPSLGGAVLGLPMGFFLRQSSLSPVLAPGAQRILLTAFVLSLAIAFLRRRRVVARARRMDPAGRPD